MGYYEASADGCVNSVGIAPCPGAAEIPEERYNAVWAAIALRPVPPDGCAVRLAADTLAWETYARPAPEPVYTQEALNAMTNVELEAILYSYGISANMNKANLVRLILAAQGGGLE